jgi:ureidoglycolate dehydrogenase (NAD+)
MQTTISVPADELAQRLHDRLASAGACEGSCAAAVKAMMHASRIGVDSHGARLVAHYCEVLAEGRINARPSLSVRRTGAASAVVDGDDGLGHHAAYRAMEVAVDLAREGGVGAVGVVRSSHYGAAGAYAMAAAEAGMVGFATTNADSAVTLFEGVEAFHGTNPLAFAAPSGGERPWLFDMATSSIPMNRVFLYRSLGRDLPAGVAADGGGSPTSDAGAAAMLLPLGGADFGFKGAGLAGVATVLSAVLTGATLDHEMIPMVATDDKRSPRGMGHFVLALNPERFGGSAAFAAGMASYLAAIRGAAGRPGAEVLAPGDREWRVEIERMRDGIPVDLDTAAFLGLEDALEVERKQSKSTDPAA